jgi:hypothetical protein
MNFVMHVCLMLSCLFTDAFPPPPSPGTEMSGDGRVSQILEGLHVQIVFVFVFKVSMNNGTLSNMCVVLHCSASYKTKTNLCLHTFFSFFSGFKFYNILAEH